MAAEVRRVAQSKLSAKPASLTAEQTYWHTFKTPSNLKSPTSHAITSVRQPLPHPSTLQASSDTFVVTTGARLQIFSTKTRKLLKNITRFNDTAHGGDIRYDGRVVAAGDELGTVQVFDVNSRAILKTWKEIKQPVWTTRWSPRDTTSLMSCGDDNTIRLWDLPSSNSVTIFRGHADYVRTGQFMPNGNLLLSGSYDQTVRLWDPRVAVKAVLIFKHIGAVENVLAMPSGNTIVAAAENQVAVLDLVAGKALQMIKNHQKTVTSLALANNSTRLITGALDGHLKVFETTGWNVVAGSKYPSPILSLAVLSSGSAQEDKHVAVGMENGVLSIKTRLSGAERVKERERRKEMDALIAGTIEEHDKKLAKKRGRGWEKRLRGRGYSGEGADIVIETNEQRKKPLHEWEKQLHAGRYKDALDIVLAKKQKLTIFTVLSTLRYRSALRASLEGRDEVTLQPVMKWVYRYVQHPPFAAICVEISMNIMDLYSRFLPQSSALSSSVEKLHARIDTELGRCHEAGTMQGMLEILSPEAVW